MMYFLNESFIVAVCFVLFIYLSYRPVKKAVMSSLDKHIAQIKENVVKSEELRQQAEKLLQETRAELAELDSKRKKILDNSMSASSVMVAEKIEEIDALFAKKKDSITKSADQEITHMAAKLKSDFGQEVINLVTEYMKSSKNNSASEYDIIKNILK